MPRPPAQPRNQRRFADCGYDDRLQPTMPCPGRPARGAPDAKRADRLTLMRRSASAIRLAPAQHTRGARPDANRLAASISRSGRAAGQTTIASDGTGGSADELLSDPGQERPARRRRRRSGERQRGERHGEAQPRGLTLTETVVATS